jgi:hypothetical protein
MGLLVRGEVELSGRVFDVVGDDGIRWHSGRGSVRSSRRVGQSRHEEGSVVREGYAYVIAYLPLCFNYLYI